LREGPSKEMHEKPTMGENNSKKDPEGKASSAGFEGCTPKKEEITEKRKNLRK